MGEKVRLKVDIVWVGGIILLGWLNILLLEKEKKLIYGYDEIVIYFHFISFFSGFSLYLWSQNNLLHQKYKIYGLLEGIDGRTDKTGYIMSIRRNKGICWRWDDSFYFLNIIIIIFLNISLTSLSNRSIVWQVLYCVLSHMCVLAVVRFIFATSH